MQAPLPPTCDPRVARLHEYWHSIRPRADCLPGRQHFDPVHVPALLPWVWLLDVWRDPLRFRYRLVGTELARLSGRDITGQWIDEVHAGFTTMTTYPQFLAAVRLGEVGYHRGPSLFSQEGKYVERERLLLPLARDGARVDIVLGITVHHQRPLE